MTYLWHLSRVICNNGPRLRMQIENFSKLQKITKRSQQDFLRLGIVLVFFLGILAYSTVGVGVSTPEHMMLVVAAIIGGYMAMNIGANDVANNVGPAVGSKSLTMAGAIVIAAIFEMMGALIAGGDVISTIRGGIVDMQTIPSTNQFIWVMISSLLAGALWLNFATAIGAPVSTTHSVVGAVLGAGVTAGGLSAANWWWPCQIAPECVRDRSAQWGTQHPALGRPRSDPP